MSGKEGLTLHVLDVTRGLPAAGVDVVLSRDGAELARVTTNADGRCDEPLLVGDAFASGRYELEFSIGDYFGAAPDDRYLDVVPVRFGIAAGDRHVHVALLVTPWSYTTYRGS